MTAPAAGLSPDRYREVIGHFTSGVTIVTTVVDGRPHGTTASAVSSLSLEPPMVLVCLNRASSTRQAVAAAGAFAVNILAEGQGELAVRFASKGVDRFAGVGLHGGASGQPLLDDALATLECRITEQVEAATHTVFLAQVEQAGARPGAPLAYFRGHYGRLDLTADQAVYGELREWLLRGSVAEGRTLAADALAEELDASSASVLHGLAQLSSEGLLERQLDGTYAVRVASDDVVADIYRARETIEVGVATATVGRVSRDALAILRELAEATAGTITADGKLADVDSWVRANRSFHEFMVGLGDSPALLAAYRGLGLSGVDIQRLFSGQRVDVLVEDHRRLVEAYEQADVERACRVIAAHTRRPLELGARAPGRSDSAL
ncbi:MAG: flavin reductase [Solirubrobacterales bacterium]|nr:flavin reductase [Solirubrobacterales bacterium]MBV9716011.1 flavin reductase [Solirubrobacterales bacterium]